jgi:hypothetical protein
MFLAFLDTYNYSILLLSLASCEYDNYCIVSVAGPRSLGAL